MNRHITRAALDATGTPAQVAAAKRAEAKFDQVTHCTRCATFLSAEIIWRRMYTLAGIRALTVLCDACNTAVPVDSAADAEFQQQLASLAMASVPAGGRA